MVQIPRIPSVDVQTGQVVPAQAPQVRPMQDFSAEQIGQLGEGMMRAGRGAVRYAAYQQRQAEIEEAQNAENIAMQSDMALRDHLIDQLNPENGYQSKVGQEAIDGYKPLLESAEKKAQDIEDSLDGDLAKKMFRRQADQRLMSFKADASQHYYKKRQTFRIGLMQAEADAAKGDASRVLNTFDATPSNLPDEYQQLLVDKDGKPRQVTPYQFNIEKYQAYLRRAGAEAGLDKTAIDSAVKEATSGLHAEALDVLIDQDPERAQTYLDKYRDDLDSKIQSVAANKIESATLDKFGREYAESINAEIDPNIGPYTRLDLGYQAARSAFDKGAMTEKQFQAVEQNLSAIAQRQNSLHRQKQTEMTERFEAFAQQNGIQSWEQLEQVNGGMASQLDALGLKRTAQGYIESGNQFATKPGAFEELSNKDQKYWLSLESETAVNSEWRTKLSNDHLNQAKAMWRNAHKLATDKDKSDMNDNDRIKSSWLRMIGGVGLTADQIKDYKDKGLGWALDLGDYDLKVKEMFEKEGKNKTTPLTNDDKQKLLEFIEADVVEMKNRSGKQISVPTIMVGLTPYLADETTAVIKVGDREVSFARTMRARNPKGVRDPSLLNTANAEGLFPDEATNPARRKLNESVDASVRSIIFSAQVKDPLKKFSAAEVAYLIVKAENAIQARDKKISKESRVDSILPVEPKVSQNADDNPKLGSNDDVLLFDSLIESASKNDGKLSDDKLLQLGQFLGKDEVSDFGTGVGVLFGTTATEKIRSYAEAYSNDLVALKMLNQYATEAKRLGFSDTRLLTQMPILEPYYAKVSGLRDSAQKILQRQGLTVPVEDAVVLSGIPKDKLLSLVGDQNKSFDSVSGERVFDVMSASGSILEFSDESGNTFAEMRNDFSWETTQDYQFYLGKHRKLVDFPANSREVYSAPTSRTSRSKVALKRPEVPWYYQEKKYSGLMEKSQKMLGRFDRLLPIPEDGPLDGLSKPQ